MRLFRSEEHVRVWSAQAGVPMGATFGVDTLWRLAQVWFHDRLLPAWHRQTIDEAHARFAAAGLAGAFWRLDG